MARSNKPILWLPFAGGGLVAALIIPVLILITGFLVPLGLSIPYEKMAAFAHNPIGKLILFGTIALPAWHAAHRLRMTAHDLGLGGGAVVKMACYGSAGALMLLAAVALLVI